MNVHLISFFFPLVEHNDMETRYPRLDVPGTEFMPMNRQVNKLSKNYFAQLSFFTFFCGDANAKVLLALLLPG